MNTLVRDIETGSNVNLDDFINRRGIVVLYFTSYKVSVHPRIKPVLSRLIKKWNDKGVSIGICDLGHNGSSGVKVGEHDIHFFNLPLIFFYHSGELKYTLQTINQDEEFEELFVKMFSEYNN